MKNSDGVRAIYATSAGALFYVLAATFTSERGVARAGLKFQNPNAQAEWSRRRGGAEKDSAVFGVFSLGSENHRARI